MCEICMHFQITPCPIANWHCLPLTSKTKKSVWSQVQMSWIFVFVFLRQRCFIKIYLWILQTDIDTLFRQTLDEFSEIQKLSREVTFFKSAHSSHSSLLRNARRQSLRSWQRSWRASRARLKRFCCLSCCPHSVLPSRMTWISTSRQRSRRFQRSPAPILIIPLCLMPFLSPSLMKKVGINTNKESSPVAEGNPWFFLIFWSNQPGRHLVAARDIPVGEMIVVEEPLCSILAPEKLGRWFCCFFKLVLTYVSLQTSWPTTVSTAMFSQKPRFLARSMIFAIHPPYTCLFVIHTCFIHLTHICLFTPFALQTCCAVVFCSKDCRRKASQGYHR